MKLRFQDIKNVNGNKFRIGYNDCPLCKNTKSLTMNEYSLKCMSPGCTLHTNFSYVYLLSQLGFTKEEINEQKPSNHSPADFYERIDLFTKVFKYSKVCAETYQDIALDALNKRGYANVLLKQEFGFLPDDENCLRKKFNPKLLEKHGFVLNNFEPFSNRLIFPVYDNKNRLVHFNARTLDKNNPYRWMSSSSMETVAPVNNFLFNTSEWNKIDRTVFLTEGISDGLSLMEIGYTNVLSSFGLEPKLEYYKEIWENTHTLVAIYDNDVYEKNSALEGQYKSWNRILLHLFKLRLNYPDIKIICVTPPKTKNVKDLNDWLLNGLTQKIFKDYLASSLLLEEFAFEYYKNYAFTKDFLKSLFLEITEDSVKQKFYECVKSKSEHELIQLLVNINE